MTTTTVETSKETLNEGRSKGWGLLLREFLANIVFQNRILSKAYPGVMHFLLFWGVSIQILGTILSLLQYQLFLPFPIEFLSGNTYLIFELVMDLAGIMIIMGVFLGIFRRLITRPSHLETHLDDWYALGILLLLPVLGFITEGLRLQAVNPEWRLWSPIGNIVANIFASLGLEPQAADSLHQIFLWTHIGAGLVFFASIPFTKLKHLLTGPLNILARPRRAMGELELIKNIEEVEKLGVGQIDEYAPSFLLAFNACAQCGRCEEVCPANFSGMALSPRVVIRNLRNEVQDALVSPNGNEILQLTEKVIESEIPWQCTTCGACINACPMFINPVDALIEMRRFATLTTGDIPASVGEALMGMERRGNPWSMPKESHAPWTAELGIREISPGEETDVLLYLGCAIGYDSRSQKVGRALATLLQKAGVDYAILGSAEVCCGETARRLGNEYLFQVMAEENIATLGSIRFNKIVTACAHCFNTLKNEYPQLGGDYQVQHHTEFLAELIANGRLSLSSNGSEGILSYHDSCYLGRYNEIYSAPRELLRSIPEIELIEFDRRQANGFCCGGGGGQMWMETDPNTRINHRRLEEIMANEATDNVVTACPYCLIMFDDAIRSKGIGDSMKVKDIAEVLVEHTPR